jgi:5-(carboxyamino)imidazole ribonucleotide mutase
MSDKNPKVGVIMGSDSDWPTMKAACDILDEFQIPYEKKVVSAHRTPDDMADYGKSAREKGIQVIIAGAGGAAHLPGMTAAHTTLPVIGVPVKTSTLSGLDSLYSIVQMPPGVPVATVAIGKAGNAALLAIRMLSMTDPNLVKKLEAYHNEMAKESREKTKNLT